MDGGLAASVAGVSNYYGDGTNSSVGENTVRHSYAGKAKTKPAKSKIKQKKKD